MTLRTTTTSTSMSLPPIATLAQIKTARVKCLDFHPVRPHLLIGLYSGELLLQDFRANATLRSVQVTTQPVRAVRYFADGTFFAAGSDDGQLRIYESYSMQLRTTVKAHVDYIRSVALHPSAPVLFTTGDDMVIRAWSFTKQGALTAEADLCGHEHFVMSIRCDAEG